MIIDLHAHTTNSRLNGLHVASATIADLENYAKDFSIDLIVLMATYFPLKNSGVFNHSLRDRIAGHQRFLMFGSIDATSDLPKGIDQLQESAEARQIAGIKLYPGYQDFDFASSAMAPVYELAKKHGLPVAFHSGELHHCCPKDENGQRVNRCGQNCQIDQLGYLAHPKQIALAVKKFPEVKFILCHLANPFFAELRQVMNKCENVSTDISGQFVSGTAEDTKEYRQEIIEQIKRFLDLPDGLDRVMFGTDFPIQSYADSIALVESLGLSPSDQQKIYWQNAAKLLNLKGEVK